MHLLQLWFPFRLQKLRKKKKVKTNFCGQSDALTTRVRQYCFEEKGANKKDPRGEGGIPQVKDDGVFSPPSRVLLSKSELPLYEKSMEGEE